jgi:predicted flavoprotein YhiN
MNQRIKELSSIAKNFTAEDAAHLSRVHNRTLSLDELGEIFTVKFAQLIVKECMAICEQQRVKILENPNDPSWTEHLAECQTNMQQIFGVEE